MTESFPFSAESRCDRPKGVVTMSEKQLGVFPKGEKNDAYAKYFVGQSYLKMLTTSGVNIET